MRDSKVADTELRPGCSLDTKRNWPGSMTEGKAEQQGPQSQTHNGITWGVLKIEGYPLPEILVWNRAWALICFKSSPGGPKGGGQ